MIPPFHLAFAVDDLEVTKRFYFDVLGCQPGRESDRWVDFDLFGHQLTAHAVHKDPRPDPTNEVDTDAVPIPHFGLILEWEAWHDLADRLRERGTDFVIEPRIRFRDEIGEQATMFLRDPSGNALEFKSFKDPARVFAS